MRTRPAVVLVLAAALLGASAAGFAQEAAGIAQEKPFGLPLRGEEAETFLKTAGIVKRKALGKGITASDQLTLSDGTRTLKAVWKTIDEFKRGVTSFPGAGVMVDYEDSYRFEIAAYELDKLLGFDLVPDRRADDQQQEGLRPDVDRGRDDGGRPQAEGGIPSGHRKRGTPRSTACACSTS